MPLGGDEMLSSRCHLHIAFPFPLLGLQVQEPWGSCSCCPWHPPVGAACGPGQMPAAQKGHVPVVGRIRTCAGKPQWISSPSPSPLGHNYLLQPCPAHHLPWANTPTPTHFCTRLLSTNTAAHAGKITPKASTKKHFAY